MTQTTSESNDNTGPWWKFGHMWMVVGGPAIVVVASFITLYFAVTRPDPVMDQNYYQKGLELNKSNGVNPAALAPAMQARNHAATGVPGATSVKPVDAP